MLVSYVQQFKDNIKSEDKSPAFILLKAFMINFLLIDYSIDKQFQHHLSFRALKEFDHFQYQICFLCISHQSGMMIAPVLANLGPLEELSFKPNPGEVHLYPVILALFLFCDHFKLFTRV